MNNAIMSLSHNPVKDICNGWWMSKDMHGAKEADSIVGSLVFWANGTGNTSRVIGYDPDAKLVLTETKSCYRLGDVDKLFALSHPEILKQFKQHTAPLYSQSLKESVPHVPTTPIKTETRLYPKRGQVYTYEEIQNLYLRDCEHLNFDLNGKQHCLQDSNASPEEIIAASPRIAGSKWVYVRETFEWIPIFKYADERPITEIIDRHREHGEYVFIFAGFPRG